MRGVVHVDAADRDTVRPRGGHQLLQRVVGAGHHDRAGPVDGGQRQPAAEPAAHLLGGQGDGHHAARPGQFGQQPRADRHHPRTVRQRQRSRHAGGGDLPLRVADHPVHRYAPVLPHPRQRHHHREQGGLHHVHRRGGGAVRTAQHPRERPVDPGRQRLLALPDAFGEHLAPGQQRAAHTPPLRALAGEHQHGTALAGLTHPHRGGQHRVRPPAERRERVQQFSAVPGDGHGPVREGGPGGRQRPRHVTRRKTRFRLQPRPQRPRLRGERGGGPRTEDERQPLPERNRLGLHARLRPTSRLRPTLRCLPALRWLRGARCRLAVRPRPAVLRPSTAGCRLVRPCVSVVRCLRVVRCRPAVRCPSTVRPPPVVRCRLVPLCPSVVRCPSGPWARDLPGREDGRRRGRRRGRERGQGVALLQDDVCIGAADAERRHAGQPSALPAGPGVLLRQQGDPSRRPVHRGGRRLRVEGRGQHLVPERLHGLDEPADAGRRLGVPQVRLEGAEVQGAAVLTPFAVHGEQRLGLDGVAQLGAGAVRLDGVDVGAGDARAGEGGPDDALLGGAVGRGQPVGGAVLVDGGAPDDGEHLVPQAPCVRQPFQQHHSHAFGPAGAVRVGRERLAASVRGQSALAGELDEEVGCRHHRGTAGQRRVALALPQCLAGQMDGHQRGRAGGVDGDGRPFQPEQVGDPAGHHAVAVGQPEDALQTVGDAVEPRVVVVVHRAGEHPGAASAQRLGADPGVLDRLPRRLQHEPLLRVHREGLAGRDAEEAGVEARRVVEETAFAGVGGAGPVPVRVVEPGQVPAAVGGEGTDGVPARADQPPQVLRCGDPARVPARHAHHRDGLVRCAGGRGRPLRAGGRPGARQGLQVPGERRRGRMVEGDGRGEPDAERRGQPVAQPYRHQGVEAQLPQRPFGVHGTGVRVSDDGGDLGPDEVQQVSRTAGRRRGVAWRRRFGHRLAQPGGEVREQRRGAGRGEQGQEPGPHGVHQHTVGAQGHALLQCPHGVGDGQRHQSAPPQVPLQPGVHHAAAGPGAPCEGDGRPAAGPSPGGERVEGGVGGAVRRLAGRAPHTGDGGEEHEGVHVGALQHRVQHPGALGLGRQDGTEVLRSGLQYAAPAGHACRVEDRAYGGAVARCLGHQTGYRGTVGDIGRDDAGGCTGGGELRRQLPGARRLRTAPGDEQQ